MDVIIAGPRYFPPGHPRAGQAIPLDLAGKMVEQAIHGSGWWGKITTVHSGGAVGIDAAGEAYSRNVLAKEPVIYPPLYRFTGDRSAPLRRNQQMVDRMKEIGGGLVAVWDGKSSGTKDVIDRAKEAGIPVYVKRVAWGD